MNGDGKLDIIASDPNNILLMTNLTSAGNINATDFPVKLRIPLSGSPRVFIGDLDGDGRPEIVGTNDKVSILKNHLPIPVAISAVSPINAAPGTALAISGANFSPTASDNIVYFGAAKAVPTAITGTTELTVKVPDGASYGP